MTVIFISEFMQINGIRSASGFGRLSISTGASGSPGRKAGATVEWRETAGEMAGEEDRGSRRAARA